MSVEEEVFQIGKQLEKIVTQDKDVSSFRRQYFSMFVVDFKQPCVLPFICRQICFSQSCTACRCFDRIIAPLMCKKREGVFCDYLMSSCIV